MYYLIISHIAEVHCWMHAGLVLPPPQITVLHMSFQDQTDVFLWGSTAVMCLKMYVYEMVAGGLSGEGMVARGCHFRIRWMYSYGAVRL